MSEVRRFDSKAAAGAPKGFIEKPCEAELGTKMRKIVHPVLALLGLLFAAVALSYLCEVWHGIAKHSPMCAPITGGTLLIVFAFTAIGAGVSAVGMFAARRRWRWIPVALLAVVLNAAAFSTWGYWVGNKMLLPYDQFCEKVGMP